MFKGYATRIGIEVTWHEVDIRHLAQEQLQYLLSYSEMLKTLKCENIMSFLHSWVDSERKLFCFITESLCSSSILEQIEHQPVPAGSKALQKWFSAVLQGLDYLHSRPNPIIHNKISLASIYLKASSGHVKIAPPLVDPSVLRGAANSLRISNITPPEALTLNMSTASDIWQFGIAMLKATTNTEPYAECKTPIELINKLTNFQPPDCINMVTNPTLLNLIKCCLQPTRQRPTARALLLHPFFKQTSEVKQETNKMMLNDNDNFQVIYSCNQMMSSKDMLLQQDPL